MPADDQTSPPPQSMDSTPGSIADSADTDELEDEFNDVIAAIDIGVEDALSFDLPENFDVNDLLENICFTTEITESQTRINAIIAQLKQQHLKCKTFIKKVLSKMSTSVKSLEVDKSGAIPENKLATFFSQVHEYSTSLGYIMDCLDLFDIGGEQAFQEEHRITCYRILEYIREFVMEQKVSELKPESSKLMKRFITDSCKPRIRYVAGYCVASLRKHYVQLKQTNIFAHSSESQSSFKEAKIALNVINCLKEEEHYLKEVTNDPDSLMDIDRRQNYRRGLTNVTDSMFDFFLCLTKTCMSNLVQENLVRYGESMYNKCLDVVRSDSSLYEKFSHMVVTRLHSESVEDFYDSTLILSEYMENIVYTSAQICQIYNELVQKYFMVLFAQFRRDVKSILKVQKTMAHRKQIKVSKSAEKSSKPKSSDKKKSKSAKKTSKSRASGESRVTSQVEPVPGPSTQNDPPAELMDSDNDSDVCAKCGSGEGTDWIQCDSCNSWLHRKCAGLSNYMKWKKYSKDSAIWYCKECQ